MRHHFFVTGMHCRSCELLLERELILLPGIRSVHASVRQGTVLVDTEDSVDASLIERAIRNAGYGLGTRERRIWLSHDPEEYGLLLFAGILVAMIFIGARTFNRETLSFSSSVSGVLPSLILGVTAGVSTCMALIGGLVLGLSARHAARHPEATLLQRMRPHLFFHVGRVFGFAFFGGALGAVGSLVVPSSVFLGILTILVGVFMALLGLQVVHVSPLLSAVRFTLPAFIARRMGIHTRHNREYSHQRAMVLGALTFFLPCGFTQIAQMAAVASGGSLLGASIMAAFALGTAPGLLGIGSIATIVRGFSGRLMQKVAGVAVIALALVNISNGINLTGWTLPQWSSSQAVEAVRMEDGAQVVRMTQEAYGYVPDTFVLRRNVPVRWVIDSVESRSCASSIRIPALGISMNLLPGENIITFTPRETGKLRFTCSMGMFSGTFTVID